LIAVIGGESVHKLGYFYIVMPVALGACVMLAVALAQGLHGIDPSLREIPFL